MEEIFNKTQTQKLREGGFSIREIANKLNIPKSTVSDSLKVSEVSEKKGKVSETVSQSQGNPLSKQEIEIILKEFQDNLLEKVEETVKNKIQNSINYYVNNYLNNTVERVIRSNLNTSEKEGLNE